VNGKSVGEPQVVVVKVVQHRFHDTADMTKRSSANELSHASFSQGWRINSFLLVLFLNGTFFLESSARILLYDHINIIFENLRQILHVVEQRRNNFVHVVRRPNVFYQIVRDSFSHNSLEYVA
jgi:hypothetical protein